MPSTAIVIFAFNRPQHLEQTLMHLVGNADFEKLPLYFFIDGPRNQADVVNVQAVIDIANNLKHPNKMTFSKIDNAGLRSSVIHGMSQIFETYNSAIVLEDDICTHPDFINYHLKCLETYKNRIDIWSVSGFVIPRLGEELREQTGQDLFLAPRASSWGWSTWKDRWEKAEWDKNKIRDSLFKNIWSYHHTGGDKLRMLLRELNGSSSSWAILWDYNHFINQASCVYPFSSFVSNIGLDHSGTHSKPFKPYAVDLEKHLVLSNPNPEIKKSETVMKAFSLINRKFYRLPFDFYNLMKLYFKDDIQ